MLRDEIEKKSQFKKFTKAKKKIVIERMITKYERKKIEGEIEKKNQNKKLSQIWQTKKLKDDEIKKKLILEIN